VQLGETLTVANNKSIIDMNWDNCNERHPTRQQRDRWVRGDAPWAIENHVVNFTTTHTKSSKTSQEKHVEFIGRLTQTIKCSEEM
jgi:hypothetical protein